MRSYIASSIGQQKIKAAIQKYKNDHPGKKWSIQGGDWQELFQNHSKLKWTETFIKWKRFVYRKPVNSIQFKIFCEILELDFNEIRTKNLIDNDIVVRLY